MGLFTNPLLCGGILLLVMLQVALVHARNKGLFLTVSAVSKQLASPRHFWFPCSKASRP